MIKIFSFLIIVSSYINATEISSSSSKLPDKTEAIIYNANLLNQRLKNDDLESAIKKINDVVNCNITKDEEAGITSIQTIEDSFVTLIASLLIMKIYYEQCENQTEDLLKYINEIEDKILYMLQNYMKIKHNKDKTIKALRFELYTGIRILKKLTNI